MTSVQIRVSIKSTLPTKDIYHRLDTTNMWNRFDAWFDSRLFSENRRQVNSARVTIVFSSDWGKIDQLSSTMYDLREKLRRRAYRQTDRHREKNNYMGHKWIETAASRKLKKTQFIYNRCIYILPEYLSIRLPYSSSHKIICQCWNGTISEPIFNNAHVRRILFPPTVAHTETRQRARTWLPYSSLGLPAEERG